MSSTVAEDRTSLRHRGQHHLALLTEPLEPRQLLATVAPGIESTMTFAIGLPIASLETGAYIPVPAEATWQNANQTSQEIVSADLAMSEGASTPGIGLATPSQTYQTSQASVSLPLFESAYGVAPLGPSTFGPSATGPASTLNPLGYGSETAIAAASEVVHPTPGRSDRISSIVRTLPIVPLPHYDSPDPEIIQQPEIQDKAPAKPIPPVQQVQPPEMHEAPPAKPTDEVKPVVPVPVNLIPGPDATPSPLSFQAWDAAIEFVENDLPEVTSAVSASHAEGSLAVGALLAAWGGWNYRARLEGRSRSRPLSIEALEFARNGAGR
jgi:hypothetical protein